MKKIGKRILSMILVAAICVGQASAAETAAKIRLAKTEGTVGVSNSGGRSLSSRKDMLLYNGYHVKTEEKSCAWVSLDDDKIDKLDASSVIELRKDKKKLEILLNEGNLYFNVAKPLEEDESLNIRTSTMVVGIRGTCGWVRVIDQWSTEVCVLEGTVQCTVTDPVSGQSKTTTVTGGSRAVFTVYDPERQGDKCDILRDTFTEGDVPGFVLVELIQNKALCETIYQNSGLDLRNITPEEAGARLSEDQAENARKQTERKKLAEEQERHIAVDPVWVNTPPSSNSGGGGGGTSSPSTPSTPSTPPSPATYTVTFNANGGSVTPASGTTGTDGTLSGLPTPAWDGYAFDGWFTAADGGTEVTISTAFSTDTTIYAHWTEPAAVT